jgi:hypothetical protein
MCVCSKQTRLRCDLRSLSKNILKKAGITLSNDSSHGALAVHSSSSSLSASSHGHPSALGLGASSHGRLSSSSSSASSASSSSSSDEVWIGLDKIRAGESGANIIHDLKIPFAKMWSASLIPTPNDYGNHIDIIGNVFAPLADTMSYKPPPGLLEWLLKKKKGLPDPPIFVGFGSMVIKVTHTYTHIHILSRVFT